MLANYLKPAFLICVAVLALCGGGMSIAVKRLGGYLKKEPTPLKKSLDRMDENGLGVFKVVRKGKSRTRMSLSHLARRNIFSGSLRTPAPPPTARLVFACCL